MNETVRADRDVQGKFLPGNAFQRAVAFQKGHGGYRPMTATPAQVAERVGEYFDECADTEKRPTVAGMALAIGISRQALDKWRKGECGKSDEEKRAYVDILSLAMTRIESVAEELAADGKGSAFTALWAKNAFGWRDERHLHSQHTERQVLAIELPEGPLRAALTNDTD